MAIYKPKHFGIALQFLLLLMGLSVQAQNTFYELSPLPLNDLSAFRSPAACWQIVGETSGSPENKLLISKPGSGVLFDNFSEKFLYKRESDLYSVLEHGDIYLELDFMLPKGSNSGIYLQSRYEVQLFDSWGAGRPKYQDAGAIYPRWIEATKTNYEGHAPRVNASLAPGLWQHLEIHFQAPEFDAQGRKTKPAMFSKIVLNGVTIHENIILQGVTRGAVSETEVAKAPIRIQGDHGPVAFRNIKYALLNPFEAPLKELTYQYYEGNFENFEALATAKLTREGKAERIDYTLADNVNRMGLVFTGKIEIKEAANYQWILQRYGSGKLSVDGKEVIPSEWKWIGDPSIATTYLGVGEHTFTASYVKNFGWWPTAAGLSLQKTNGKPIALHTRASMPDPRPTPLIAVGTKQEPSLLRCFFQHLKKKKTHVILVGDPSSTHYAYDLNQGALLQVWRGEFANVTDMWHERGEPQTASAMGVGVVLPGRCPLAIDGLPDTLDQQTDLKYQGYQLSAERYPTFKYQYRNVGFTESFKVATAGQALERITSIKNPEGKKFTYRLAQGAEISSMGNGLYAVDGQRYFIRVADPANYKIVSNNGQKELIFESAQTDLKVSSSLIF
ncbi:MAG TPA: DUF1080 domain-containing protein [Haliscomenobacter sp.]|uniref:3-keto-disaccharide hydrolase n=1 Tax=Haliscomenobacter sp. TaxID=2717303 RepID=UPI002C7C6210|nr:DUF1080 domain-containing protein [Haliscomenobacter sp.]HOY17948.1 DUF1080 domain-containing protein [Haliscomenobacter sp.]HPH18162.1 DUF1080 domain-containing protein [Haliscomenobacter sp.]